jgi:hypothetical protein
MADASPRRTSPWIAFAAGVVATLAIVLAWWALSAGRRAADEVRLVAPLPDVADLPAPRLPEAPRLPSAPMPGPR